MIKKIESEKALEAKLRNRVKAAGGLALKVSSQHYTGMPDRMVLMPGGRITFAEMKSTGQKPTKAQQLRHEELRRLGFEVFILDTTDKINEFMDHITENKHND